MRITLKHKIFGWASMLTSLFFVIISLQALSDFSTLDEDFKIDVVTFIIIYTLLFFIIYSAYLTYGITKKKNFFNLNSMLLILFLIIGEIWGLAEIIWIKESVGNNFASTFFYLILSISAVINSIPLLGLKNVDEIRKTRKFSYKVILASVVLFVLLFVYVGIISIITENDIQFEKFTGTLFDVFGWFWILSLIVGIGILIVTCVWQLIFKIRKQK